jgi:nickel-dependent lactate racemase
MTTTVHYGDGQSCEIALGEHTFLAPNAAEIERADDLAAAVRTALSAPLGFPPLAAALVPGDRVAIALGRSIPQVGEVLRGAIAEIVAAGLEPADVTVVSAETIDAAARGAVEQSAEGVQFALHDPNDEAGIAMVGLTADKLPLRINRTLAEADFVLPIATARFASADGSPAGFRGLFPRFSNRETADRFHGRGKSAGKAPRVDRGAEADEAAWKLGVGLVLVIVPGPGDAVAGIVAGTPSAAAQAGAEAMHAIWERPTAQQGDLVIAAVAGDASEQTWANFSRAVAAADRVLAPGGAIVVCCELDQAPSGSFERLRDAVDFGDVALRLQKGAADDARPARILAQALDRGPVYLMSPLPGEVAESLGMTPIESEAELSRLAAGRRHCVVIEEAQRVRPRLVVGSERS